MQNVLKNVNMGQVDFGGPLKYFKNELASYCVMN